MNTNPDDWWLRRRHPSVNAGDGWSGGGKAYRAWMGTKAKRAAPEWHPNPRAARFVRTCGRPRLGRSIALGVAGLAAVVLLAPLAWAGRWHPCAAAEVALVDGAVGRGSRFEGNKWRVANWAGPDGKLLSHGRVGKQIASQEHAGWPPFAGCTALFWRARAEGASLGGFTAALVRALSARR